MKRFFSYLAMTALAVGAIPVATWASDTAVAAVSSTTMGHLFGRCGGCGRMFRTKSPCDISTQQLGTCGCGGAVVQCDGPANYAAPAPCAPSVAPAPVVVVEPTFETRTVLVPEWTTETREVNVETCVPVERTREVTVQKLVPVVEERTREVTQMVREQRTRVEEYTVAVPYTEQLEQTYTVQVPYQVKQVGTRIVTQQVPVTTYRTVREDQGCWSVEQVPVATQSCGRVYASAPSRCRVGLLGRLRGLRGCASHCGRHSGCGSCGQSASPCGGCDGGCGGCGGCSANVTYVTRRVWVPNIVERQVEVTCYKTVEVEVPHEYAVTEYRTEERTRTVSVQKVRHETHSREVAYEVCVPKTHVETYQVTNYQSVPETRVETYTELEPQMVTKQVQVQVQRMVEKTIQVRIDQGCGCGSAAGAVHHHGCAPAPCAPAPCAPVVAPCGCH
ncbi:MAG: hypothetical protein KDA83_01950 [Planctomycetales bacterium]|nr:hypothetical protein [Planctomycetales bacterium]